MKLEDLKDQTALDKLIADSVKGAVEEATEGLIAKNKELIGKFTKAYDGLSEEEFESLKAASTELQKLKDGTLAQQGEFKKLYETAVEQHAIDMKTKDDAISAGAAEIKTLLVHDGLVKALNANNINPVLIDAAVRLLENDVSLVELNGKRVAQVGEKGLDSHVKDWASSEVGKNFALATNNSGGGAGGNGGGNTPDENEKHFKDATWNLTAQAALSKTDPAAYKALNDKYPTREAGRQQNSDS